ncbi:MAG: PDZ domain-containing protein [Deltaproteobacteria bacterium]|nr:PDZ domain-containing protein [Deltaproteobacteria bacterium]
MARPSGYYRMPTLHGDRLVFVCEDELFEVSASGGRARQLTDSIGRKVWPRLSPGGDLLVFGSADEGETELWSMPAGGGEARRLTYFGSDARPRSFAPDGRSVIVASTHRAALPKHTELFRVHLEEEGSPRVEALELGLGWDLAEGGPGGAVVLGRHTLDPARWKRYRGGTAGQLWLKPGDSEEFVLLSCEGNVASPFFLGERLYFVSDREGHGNLYSVALEGTQIVDRRRHTDHDDFYVRNASSDGARVVYHAGGDLFVHDPASGETAAVEVDIASSRRARHRRFVDASDFLEDYEPHPQGHRQVVVSRGKVFSFGNWEGPVLVHEGPGGGRHRLARWRHDGEAVVAVTDAPGEEALVVLPLDPALEPTLIEGLDLGRIVELQASPTRPEVALVNHRMQLLHVDLATGKLVELDRGVHSRPGDLAFSPCGSYLAYAYPDTPRTSCIRLAAIDGSGPVDVTRPVLHDGRPVWDPDGRFLFFIGARVFNPVEDGLHFELGFPWGERPYALPLQADVRSPFIKEPMPLKKDDPPEPEPEHEKEKAEAEAEAEKKDDDKIEPIKIDLEGIQDRLLPFPVAQRRIVDLGAGEGRLFFQSEPLEGALHDPYDPREPGPRDELWVWDLEEESLELVTAGIESFTLSRDASTLVYHAGRDLRAVLASDKLPIEDGFNRRAGWIDPGRLRISIDPAAEWRQIFDEAWRLQRDQFWSPDMSQVDWEAVHARYRPLVERVASRTELSDLLWEMQGELGTSHAYEYGGDYPYQPHYRIGHLGADLSLAADGRGFVIERILRGAPGEADEDSPLASPGLDLAAGDVVLAVNGQPVGARRSVGEALLHQAGQEVALTVRRGDGPLRRVTVSTLRHEQDLRYRAWVEERRALVHARSEGKVGYLHLPDMRAAGYAAFHRDFLRECDRDALVIDVRGNGGGNVSQLILEKLARKRVGFDQPRHGTPIPYFQESPAGPLVCLTDELAGSDGDIFCHCFKLLGLGKLVGMRTWGGVIGVWPRHALVDGTYTTQPEYAFWFQDVGWSVENHGVDPDLQVPLPPHASQAAEDPQLEQAVVEALAALEANPPLRPEFGPRPDRRPPTLPPRREDR